MEDTNAPRIMERIYKQYGEKLKTLFPTLEAALEVERRAIEEGDDRAVFLLGDAYRTPVVQEGKCTWTDHRNTVGSGRIVNGTHVFAGPIDEKSSDYFLDMAKEKGNQKAFEFKDSIALGNRNPLNDRDLLFYGPPALEYNNAFHRGGLCLENRREIALHRHTVSAIALRHISDVEFRALRYAGKALKPGSTDALGYPSTLRYLSRYKWKGRKSQDIVMDLLKEMGDYILPALEICARAGNAAAVEKLATHYDVRVWNFMEYYYRFGIFKDPGYENQNIASPFYDPVRAREWRKISKALKNETVHSSKFLHDFIYEQAGTPQGLYNIGVALCENRIGGENSWSGGLDVLKHAANLGNANAAKRLGDYYLAEAESGKSERFGESHFWYEIASEQGHSNGTARAAWIAKVHHKHTRHNLDVFALRNPRNAYVRTHQESLWGIKIPDPDYSFLRDPDQGSHMERLERSVILVQEQVAAFDTLIHTVRARLEAILHQEALRRGQIDTFETQIIEGLHINTTLEQNIDSQERLKKLAKQRWLKEQATNTIVGLIISTYPGIPTSAAFASAIPRAAGYRTASLNEINYRAELITNLQMQMIDTDRYEKEIAATAAELEKLSESKALAKLYEDELTQQRLFSGYLHAQLLFQGLDNSQHIEEFAQEAGIASLDDFLGAFDMRLGLALQNFCFGIAETNDMNIILAHANATGEDSRPGLAAMALKHFVERHFKLSIDDYLPKASRVDVIKTSGFGFSLQALSGRSDAQGSFEMAFQKPESDTALAALIEAKFSTVGSLNVDELFAFYLHRHGDKFARDTRVNDGQVSDIAQEKLVEVFNETETEEFVDRVKHSFRVGRIDLPQVDKLFLRICASEYFTPQAVRTSGTDVKFADHPEAPVAYPMISNTVHDFIERLSLGPIARYSESVGRKLDNLIAQSFIDYFAVLGRTHSKQFEDERRNMRQAHNSGTYGTRFNSTVRKITRDALGNFELFKKIYTDNLEKSLQVDTAKENERLKRDIHAVRVLGATILDPEEIILPGTPAALHAALERDRRFENMLVPGMQ